ncbi:MAG: AraC family transcriptional regulator [Phycisphaeraceae bacterium JB051]
MPSVNETIDEHPGLPVVDSLISFDRFGNPDMDTNISCPSIRDVLSEALIRAQLIGRSSGPWYLGRPWSVRLVRGPISFFLVKSGQCNIYVAEKKQTVELKRGDLFVLTQPSELVLSDGDVDITQAKSVIEQVSVEELESGRAVHFGDAQGVTTHLLTGILICHYRDQVSLMPALPDYIHLSADVIEQSYTLKQIFDLLEFESTQVEPGHVSLKASLLQMVLILAYRAFLQTVGIDAVEQLSSLADPEIGPLITLVHVHPGLPWSVENMAERVGMSRSAFAARFVDLVGETPMSYVTQCRMRRAAILMTNPHTNLKSLARQLGYSSEAAFSVAFKRWSGMSPGRYRTQRIKAGR